MARCATKEWRGVTVCAHFVPYLDQFAKETGAFLVTPIPGFGSYESNPTSAGTDAGGGHLDIYMTRIPAGITRKSLEDKARKILGMAYDRARLVKGGKVYWTDHMHIIDCRCPNMSSAATSQYGRYFLGRNNLASNGPDTGTRIYVERHKALFNSRKTNAAKGTYPAIVPTAAPPVVTKPSVPTKGDTVAITSPTPRAKDVANPTVKQIWDWDGIPNTVNIASPNDYYTAANTLSDILKRVALIQNDVAAIRKKLGA